MRIVRAPEPLLVQPNEKSIFLAGSIASDWRQRVIASIPDANVVLIDPRRDDWDSTWDERADDPRFRTQAEWELEAQERADLIAMYLHPESEASVSLLELGIAARSGKVIVCCPEGFWCKTLVDVVCLRHNLTATPNLDAMIEAIRAIIARMDLVHPHR